jgi:hypothetical protein
MKEKALVIKLAVNGFIVSDSESADVNVFNSLDDLKVFIDGWDDKNKGKGKSNKSK